jgi:ribonuclease BN (tRNA processing enzyme)
MASVERASLYIAGSSSAVPRPGRANSGYLVRSGACAIAIDFGTGAFARLRERIEPTQLDALVISHMHADHFFDIVPLRYALKYEMQRAPLPVYLPPGGIEIVRTIGNPLKEDADFYEGVLELHEYAPDAPLEISGCARLKYSAERARLWTWNCRYDRLSDSPAGHVRGQCRRERAGRNRAARRRRHHVRIAPGSRETQRLFAQRR